MSLIPYKRCQPSQLVIVSWPTGREVAMSDLDSSARLAQKYEELFTMLPTVVDSDPDSLEQPSPLESVPTTTTYGYQEPSE